VARICATIQLATGHWQLVACLVFFQKIKNKAREIKERAVRSLIQNLRKKINNNNNNKTQCEAWAFSSSEVIPHTLTCLFFNLISAFLINKFILNIIE
jgi:hypothetical protein